MRTWPIKSALLLDTYLIVKYPDSYITLIDKNLVMVQTDQIKVAGGCRLTIRAAQFSKLPADFVLDLTTSDQQSG